MSKPTVTMQEIFTKVATHLLAQGKKSIDDKGDDCLYRASDGCKCAIGCLIPDEAYKQSLEGEGVQNPEVINALPFESCGKILSILDVLQFLHDYTSVEQWRDRLQSIADDYGLTMPEVQL